MLGIGGAFAGGCWVGITYGNQMEFAYTRLRNSLQYSRREPEEPRYGLDYAIALAKSGGPYAILSTSNGDAISTRLIEPHSIEFDENENRPVIYFNTSLKSRKCRDMEINPKVSLIYVDLTRLRYVSFSGKVERIPFPDSTNYWKSHLIAFFPEGNGEESNFSTWKITPQTISFVDISGGVVSTRKDFRAPEIRYDEGERKWVSMCDGKEKDVPE